MTLNGLLAEVAKRGLRFANRGQGIECVGGIVSDGLCRAVKEHEAELQRLVPSPERTCQQIVSEAIDRANAIVKDAWVPSQTQWEVMDEFQDRIHDAARAGDVEWTRQAAGEYVDAVQNCFCVELIHTWADNLEMEMANDAE